MPRCRRPLVALVVAGLAILGVGSTATSATTRHHDGRLVLGSLVPETGDLMALLPSLRAPVQIAVDEVNAAGGVNGKPVSLVTADEDTTADAARGAFDRLVNADGADAVVGPATPADAVAIVGRIKAGGVLTCSGSDTASNLGAQSSGGFYFRIAPPDRLQGAALAELVLARGHSRVALLTSDDFYGHEFATAVGRRLKEGGAKVVARVTYDPSGTNVAASARTVAASRPESVVVIGFTQDGAKALQAMIANGVGPGTVKVFTSDGMQSNQLAAAVDPADPSRVAGITGTAPAAAPSGVKSPFQSAFRAKGVDQIFSSYYYDCTILTALAAVKAKSDDPARMRSAFVANVRGKADCNTFAACKQLLARGKTIHWHGASSNFDHFAGSEPAEGSYDVWSYDTSGQVVTPQPAAQITVP